MNTRQGLFLLAALSAGLAHAQLYKWTGPDGKVVYSDQPPPSSVNAEKKTIPAGGGEAALPYELAQAAGNHPVVLYTTAKCAPCDAGRNLLKERGIPYREKTVTSADDIERLQKIAGVNGQLPVLTVGRATQAGFESVAWTTALTAAGYPQSSRLPSGYVNPPAEPAAPTVKTAAVEKKMEPVTAAPVPNRPAARPSDSGSLAPSGIRF